MRSEKGAGLKSQKGLPDPHPFHCWVCISGLAAAPDQWGFRLYGGKPLQRG